MDGVRKGGVLHKDIGFGVLLSTLGAARTKSPRNVPAISFQLREASSLLGMSLLAWAKVFPKVAQITAYFLYDRLCDRDKERGHTTSQDTFLSGGGCCSSPVQGCTLWCALGSVNI